MTTKRHHQRLLPLREIWVSRELIQRQAIKLDEQEFVKGCNGKVLPGIIPCVIVLKTGMQYLAHITWTTINY